MSDWRQSAVDRRDERHTFAPDVDPSRYRRTKTNRNRWCRGKVGVEHVREWVEDEKHFNTPDMAAYRRERGVTWLLMRCTKCGKHLDRWYSCIGYPGLRPRPMLGPVAP